MFLFTVKKEGGYIDHTVKIDPIIIYSEKDSLSSCNNAKGKFRGKYYF